MVNSPIPSGGPQPPQSDMAANNMSNNGNNGGTMDNSYGYRQMDRSSVGAYGTPTYTGGSMYPSQYFAGLSASYGQEPYYYGSMGQEQSQHMAHSDQPQAYGQGSTPGGDSFSGTSKNQIDPRLFHGTPHGSTSPDALALGTM
jgi:hypothetical protein